MQDIRYIDKDFVILTYKDSQEKNKKTYLAFGDKVEVIKQVGSNTEIKALELWDGDVIGRVKGSPFRQKDEPGVMKFSMVDVQQGDGMIVETPPDDNHETKIMFIDGGDNKLFARHVAARYHHRKTSKDNRLNVDLMLITHGDADHFSGLTHIKKSETESLSDRKKIFIKPKRIYHNGLVKRPRTGTDGKKRKDQDMFGRTVKQNNKEFIVDLHDDPRAVDLSDRNRPFNKWIECIDY